MTRIKLSSLKSHKAFTLVEVVVVLAVISVLVGVGAVTSTKYQQDARDSQRSSKANIIATSLEKYYSEKNEYPSCTLMTAAPTTVKTTLKGLADVDVLRAPQAAKGTNSIQCSTNAPSSPNTFVYTCTSTTSCVKWELKYRNETDGAIKSIASARRTSVDGSIGLNSPDVNVSATISGGSGVGTASGSCSSGTINYQIRSYKNAGTFPAVWTDASTASMALNEGESATYQAQGRCSQAGLASSGYSQSNPATATRPITAPTGLTISVGISGDTAIATVGGGSCAAGTTLQRQIRYNPTSTWFGGSWTGWEDLAGTTKSVWVEQGWQVNFHHNARCYNPTTGAASAWTFGDTVGAIRPIDAPGAPAVYASGNSARIQFSWSPAWCPPGNSPEYRWYLSNNAGYTSDWWGPSTGTVFDWNDISEGYTFSGYVQQRCNTGVAQGSWSGTNGASWYRPVNAPGAPYSFTKDVLDRNLVAFQWTAPACGWMLQSQHKQDWVNGGGPGIAWINPPSGHADYWWYGFANYTLGGARPGNQGSWNAGWPNTGWIGDISNGYAQNPPRLNLDSGDDWVYDNGNIIGIAVHYRCVNTTTGAASPTGPENWAKCTYSGNSCIWS
ncbi:MAG: Prepilin-type N-terminal cleavage/methylation protein [Patescibacteria group bacterium]|nr:Prepilin-type N-terminal cleavage/methylation protein [Patescibacteria group bacterium]